MKRREGTDSDVNAVLATELDKVLQVGRDVDAAVGGRLERDPVKEGCFLLFRCEERAGDWLKVEGFLANGQGRDV